MISTYHICYDLIIGVNRIIYISQINGRQISRARELILDDQASSHLDKKRQQLN